MATCESCTLALVSTDAFEAALKQAKDAGVIALNDAQMRAAKTAFEAFALEMRPVREGPLKAG